MSKLKTFPLSLVTDTSFVPKLRKALGIETPEEPLAEVTEAWVHFGHGQVIFKFGGDNRRHCISPKNAQEFAGALLRCAEAASRRESA